MLVRSTMAMLAATSLFAADAIAPGAGNSLVAHEWGTFTTVTEADGMARVWGALGGKADLPCFVIRQPAISKYATLTRVRMETPVLYFYSQRPARISARVRFTSGMMTEWYPKARGGDPRALEWNDVDVLPGEDLEFPVTTGDSHYFAARETDAAPLRVGDQHEKLLFYRGVGDFQPPAQPRFDAEGMLEVRGVERAIVFENRDGRVGWKIVRGAGPTSPPELTGDVASLRAALVDMLTEAGLYEKEARAMVETWRDSWFEEGMRVFYLAPREFVDRELPLEIMPRPREIARVFMGRAELLPPERRAALARAVESGDLAGFEGYGRFFSAFALQVMTGKQNAVSMRYLAAKEQEIANQTSAACVR